jgi:sialate O-acetylesterase
MVLQREAAIPVWGRARRGAEVLVSLAGKKKCIRADKTGHWRVDLDPMPAGGPFELTLTSGREKLVFRNVLVGEVWIGSGQSNMEWGLSLCQVGLPTDASLADDPELRLFTVTKTTSFVPLEGCSGTWKVCDPESAAPFSAVAYHFGKQLRKALGVPVGLINTSWSGTVIETWVSREAISSQPDLRYLLDLTDKWNKDGNHEIADRLKKWEDENFARDEGILPGCRTWMKKAFDDSQWEQMSVPGAWEKQGLDIDGAVWFRTSFDLPADWPEGPCVLSLGAIDDFDKTWINGVLIGETPDTVPNAATVPRSYPVSARILKPGKNTIAVRVFDQVGEGGFVGVPEVMRLRSLAETGRSIPLAGKWRYKVEWAVPSKPPTVWSTRPQGSEVHNCATMLFNGMIAPLIPFAFRGAIWYQGESNASRAYQYRKLFPVMIEDWRRRWKNDFPFLFVQLANYMARQKDPVENDWAELREAQTMTLGLAKTGMAVTIDIGDANDIHPKNKKDVGLRLALQARAKVYGETGLVYEGPRYNSMKIEGGKVRISFHSTGGGLTAAADGLKGFSIAGDDRKFVWADAVIDGDAVVVSSPSVAKPAAVRYAWEQNPPATLFNKEGLPASPFRTDDWPGLTANAK